MLHVNFSARQQQQRCRGGVKHSRAPRDHHTNQSQPTGGQNYTVGELTCTVETSPRPSTHQRNKLQRKKTDEGGMEMERGETGACPPPHHNQRGKS